MAQNDDSGDKTEKPTQKKLNDARKKGEVPKSKEITSTLLLLVWLGLGATAVPLIAERLGVLMLDSIAAMGMPFEHALPTLGWAAIEVCLWATAILFAPLIGVALMAEYLQAGPVFTFDRLMPKMENLNPVSGVKRMFSGDNLMELFKSVTKTIVMLVIGYMVLKALLPQMALLSTTTPQQLASMTWVVTLKLVSWTVGVFAFVSILDLAWQHHSFTKKNMMSLHDIKQEHKESEGDPHLKQHRRRTHQEWSQRNANTAAANANVLVVNPTHLAMAIEYDPVTCPVPVLMDKGEDDMALEMRRIAQEAGVPVVRNVELARELMQRVERGRNIPSDMFGVLADVILWARDVREQIRAFEQQNPAGKRPRAAPGEDLTQYPEGFDSWQGETPSGT
jgi:type III secretion protein U